MGQEFFETHSTPPPPSMLDDSFAINVSNDKHIYSISVICIE